MRTGITCKKHVLFFFVIIIIFYFYFFLLEKFSRVFVSLNQGLAELFSELTWEIFSA